MHTPQRKKDFKFQFFSLDLFLCLLIVIKVMPLESDGIFFWCLLFNHRVITKGNRSGNINLFKAKDVKDIKKYFELNKKHFKC